MIIINICEGAFDALGIYYHIFDRESTEMLYVAACGAGFLSVLKYIIGMGITCNIDINIFSDADRGPGFYKKLYKELNPWVNNINLYYNRKSKDYGVTKNEIDTLAKEALGATNAICAVYGDADKTDLVSLKEFKDLFTF